MLLWVFTPLILCGQSDARERVVALQDSLKLLIQKRDSFRVQQQHLQASTDSLAHQVTQLKNAHGSGPASGDLALALRQSLKMTLVLEDLYAQEMSVRQRILQVQSDLSQACDAEIGRLIGLLTEQPDSGHIAQIQELRTLRQALKLPAEQRVLPTVMIGEDDTPSDIKLKTELMADVALQIQKEKEDVEKQIKRLADEKRLRARGISFTSEFGLFDEALSQGRSVVAAPSASEGVSEPVEGGRGPISEAEDANVPPNFDVAGIAGPPATEIKTEPVVSEGSELSQASIGREVVLDGLTGPNGEPLDELSLEIRKLQLYQLDLAKREQQAQARVARLQGYLKQLLSGQAP